MTMPRGITRRDVLMGGLGVAGLAAASQLISCAEAATPTPAPAAPGDRSATAPTSPVAIQRCESYDPLVIGGRLNAALDLAGGLGDAVRGKSVAIKINLTGATQKLFDKPAYESYQTHPSVVRATVAALAAAGAGRITIVESCVHQLPLEEILMRVCGWDTNAIRSAGGQTKVFFENTRNRGTSPAYSRLKVPGGGLLWPAFDVNAQYEKADFLVSIPKLKDHAAAGVTAACKNLFGMTPSALYGDDAPKEDSICSRVALIHDAARGVPAGVTAERQDTPPHPGDWRSWQWRVPRTVADEVMARPIDLAVVDAVMTMSGGEGWWSGDIAPIAPHLLIVGRNPVCTDAVCTAVMGYDPQAAHAAFPFPGENHLRHLAAAGVGSIDLKRIEVRGLSLTKARFPFRKVPRVASVWRHGHIERSMAAYAAGCAGSHLA
jgi:uncharacterized protein (DUF362 family)